MPALLQALVRLVALKRLGVLLFVLAATLCAITNASALGHAQTKGGFAVRPDGSARMVLPSNPTEYVVTHELGHYVHWRGVGTDAYMKLPRTPKWNAPEQFVFDQLEKPMRWWRFSDAERQHAIDYIERVGFR